MRTAKASPEKGIGRRGSSGQGKRSGRSKRPRQPAQKGHPAAANAEAVAFDPLLSPLRLPDRTVRDEELTQTRHTLLQRLKDLGDDASWRDFFETYWRLIYTTGLRAGLSVEESQDAVQETIVGVVRNIQKFKVGAEHGRFKSWLLTLTRWRIADQFRKRSPNAKGKRFMDEDTNCTPNLDGVADPASLNTDAKWEADWQQNLIDSAMARVKQRVDPLDYQMFDLHVLKLWPAAKVAALLNVKLGNVYFAKYNILGRIKKEVKKIETDFV